MVRISRGISVAVSGAVLFVLMSASAHAAVSLPHTQHFNTIAPWSQTYSGSALDSSASAPGSSSTSLRFKYGAGMANAISPDKVWVNFDPDTTEIWTQYYFMYSENFYFHSVDNKQMYWYITGTTLSSNFYVSCSGQKMTMVYQRTPGSGRRSGNTSYNPTIERGVWYKITTRAKMNTNGASNGIFQLWINDGLVIDSSNVPYLVGDDIGKKVGSLAFDPVFGGSNGSTKPATDYFYVDYVQIGTSSFGSSGDSTTSDPTADQAIPLAPSNISIQ